jgi:polyisoprenoid-binding protein YceI
LAADRCRHHRSRRDREYLKSLDFLEVDRFPELIYRRSAVSSGPVGKWRVDGALTIQDITRPVNLAMSYAGTGPDPWGGTRAAFSATAQLNRTDFEMTWTWACQVECCWSVALRIDLDVQAVLSE